MARVVKVGGSLFDQPRLPALLKNWLAQQTDDFNILIAGGGRLVDEVRALDQRFGIGEQEAHWLCVTLLGVTAGLLASLLPECAYEDDWQRLQQLARSPDASRLSVIFNVEPMLRWVEPGLPGPSLPHRWDVTSDSIAARLAQVICAHELVLLKSARPPVPFSSVADEGDYVDGYFPIASASLDCVRMVNLREVAQQ